ncbi:hypothetical protein GCM10027034_33590 [Ramlibacter solisilvae]|uniref:Uncharacterized protein n=1 Tax=Ramlibacter tataouinensis TaxID=94132 RepID=A0A127JSB6_9BURK|nr:hypothetical protein [Ramlibacter tataouinensis]AMO22871.1 hypothetical protein UC35_08170 [Ramlibacter tataouinensis]
MSATVRIVDSITELDEADAGCIAVTGSHGGVSAARFALAARPLLAVFNDAGGGRDDAGFAGLRLLQAAGLAACTVSHLSARIGDAQSSLNDGIINRVNDLAIGLGVREGQACSAALESVAQTRRRPA